MTRPEWITLLTVLVVFFLVGLYDAWRFWTDSALNTEPTVSLTTTPADSPTVTEMETVRRDAAKVLSVAFPHEEGYTWGLNCYSLHWCDWQLLFQGGHAAKGEIRCDQLKCWIYIDNRTPCWSAANTK